VTGLIASVTQHWFRHRFASIALSHGDLSSAMGQGGWKTIEAVTGYLHDVPLHRRQVIEQLPLGPTAPPAALSHSFAQNRDDTKSA